MPLTDLNIETGPSLYSQPNSRFSKATPFPEDSQSDVVSQRMAPPQQLLHQQERETQYNRDLAASKLEGKKPSHRQQNTNTTHSMSRPTSPLAPTRGELQWNWDFPQDWKSRRRSARNSKNLAYTTQWHKNASFENIGPLAAL